VITARLDRFVLVALGAAAIVLFLLCWEFAGQRGTDTDFFPRWYGLRQLLLHGHDPYADRVSQEITAQTSFLQGERRTSPGPLTAVEASYGFLYPLPGALVLAPLALLPHQVALALWLMILIIAIPAAALMAAQSFASRSGNRPEIPGVLVPVSLMFLPSVWNLVLAQPTVLVVCALAAALWASKRSPAAAGASLAIAGLLKPQLVLLLGPLWLGYHALRWRDTRSREFLLGAAGAGGLLLAAAFALLPSWLDGFARAASQYSLVGGMGTTSPAVYLLGQFVFGDQLAWPVAALAAAGIVAWTVRGWREEQQGIWRSTLATALVVPPAWQTSAFLLLLPLASTLGRLRGAPLAGIAVASVALSALMTPLSIVAPWRSGALLIAAYVALIGAGQFLAHPARQKTGNARPTGDAMPDQSEYATAPVVAGLPARD
jgi:hypothetical protein